MNNEKVIVLVSADERERISRGVLVWLNKFPDKPVAINYEQLDDDKPGMALSSIQGAYMTRRYIIGGYEAQYQYKVLYRIQPGTSNDKRLKADELLDRLGQWAAENTGQLDLGSARVRRAEINSAAAVFAAYEGGDEDHQILMTLTYEVI